MILSQNSAFAFESDIAPTKKHGDHENSKLLSKLKKE
jgi:hypothetical protein